MTVLERKAHSQVAHLTPADIEAIGLELDAIRQECHRQPRRARRGVHPAGHRRPAQDRAREPRRAPGEPVPRPGSSARSGCRSRRSWTTWRSGTTSCTGSGTGCRTRRSTPPPGTGTTRRRPSSGSAPTTSCTTRTRTSSARTTTSATASARRRGPGVAAAYLVQPLWNFINAHLRVRHRDVRPRARGGAAREARLHPRAEGARRTGAAQGAQAGRQGLRGAPRAVRAVVPPRSPRTPPPT